MSQTITAEDRAAGVAESVARRKEPRPCKECGRLPSETKFYPSRKDKCIECIKDALAKSKERHRVPDPQLSPCGPVECIQETRPTGPSVCDSCGSEFEPYQWGAVFMRKRCRACMEGLNRQRKDRVPKGTMCLDLRKDPEILNALKEVALRERRTPEMQALVILERALLFKEEIAS